MSKKKQLIALLTLAAFVSSCLDPVWAGAAALPPQAADSSSPSQLFPANLAELPIPAELGKAEDVFKGESGETIIILQDAHAIPEAQRSIEKLIIHFQNQYGVKWIGLEGADSELDPQIFKSFPDQKRLAEILTPLFERGEISGVTSAAMLSPGDTFYGGLEDWPLYERGVELYREALARKDAVLAQLIAESLSVEAQKSKIYPPKLLELDSALQSFNHNKLDLLKVLEKFASVKAPGPESEIAMLLTESRKHPAQESIDLEVKKLADEIAAKLQSTRLSILKEFNEKDQAFKTGQMTAQAYALFLTDLTASQGITLSSQFSKTLGQGVDHQRRMRDIEGTKFFRDFEAYVLEVKETLFENDAQRGLDQKSRELYLHEKLAKLELTRSEWQELKVKDKSEKLKAENKNLRSQFEFYENAESRDEALLSNLLKGMKARKAPSALIAAGGFHAEGFTRRLRDKNISYALISPKISALPEQTNYQDQMQGRVSWSNYFKIENGRVSVYKAFVRYMRDQLLASSVERLADRKNFSSTLSADRYTLKNWRDQIIRDLSAQRRIEESANYTPLLDEVPGERAIPKTEKIDRFFESLRKLESEGKINQGNLYQLLKAAQVVPGAVSLALSPRSEIRADLLRPSDERGPIAPLSSGETSVKSGKGNLIAADLTDGEARDLMRTILAEMGNSGIGKTESLIRPGEKFVIDGKTITTNHAVLAKQKWGMFERKFSVQRVGPMIFVGLENVSALSWLERIIYFIEKYIFRLDPHAAVRKMIGDIYEARQGNIMIAEPPGYVRETTDAVPLVAHLMVAALIGNAEKIKGKEILDLGAGEGLLSRIAMKLGAKKVILVDYERSRLDYSRRMMTEDGWDETQNQFEVIEGDLTDSELGAYPSFQSAEIGLMHIGAYKMYGDANAKGMDLFMRLPRLQLILNGTFPGENDPFAELGGINSGNIFAGLVRQVAAQGFKERIYEDDPETRLRRIFAAERSAPSESEITPENPRSEVRGDFSTPVAQVGKLKEITFNDELWSSLAQRNNVPGTHGLEEGFYYKGDRDAFKVLGEILYTQNPGLRQFPVVDLASGPNRGPSLGLLGAGAVSAFMVSAGIGNKKIPLAGGKSIQLQKGDVTQLKAFADNSAGGAVLNGALLFIEESQDPFAVEKTFSEAHRILAPGGTLIIRTTYPRDSESNNYFQNYLNILKQSGFNSLKVSYQDRRELGRRIMPALIFAKKDEARSEVRRPAAGMSVQPRLVAAQFMTELTSENPRYPGFDWLRKTIKNPESDFGTKFSNATFRGIDQLMVQWEADREVALGVMWWRLRAIGSDTDFADVDAITAEIENIEKQIKQLQSAINDLAELAAMDSAERTSMLRRIQDLRSQLEKRKINRALQNRDNQVRAYQLFTPKALRQLDLANDTQSENLILSVISRSSEQDYYPALRYTVNALGYLLGSRDDLETENLAAAMNEEPFFQAAQAQYEKDPNDTSNFKSVTPLFYVNLQTGLNASLIFHAKQYKEISFQDERNRDSFIRKLGGWDNELYPDGSPYGSSPHLVKVLTIVDFLKKNESHFESDKMKVSKRDSLATLAVSAAELVLNEAEANVYSRGKQGDKLAQSFIYRLGREIPSMVWLYSALMKDPEFKQKLKSILSRQTDGMISEDLKRLEAEYFRDPEDRRSLADVKDLYDHSPIMSFMERKLLWVLSYIGTGDESSPYTEFQRFTPQELSLNPLPTSVKRAVLSSIEETELSAEKMLDFALRAALTDLVNVRGIGGADVSDTMAEFTEIVNMGSETYQPEAWKQPDEAQSVFHLLFKAGIEEGQETVGGTEAAMDSKGAAAGPVTYLAMILFWLRQKLYGDPDASQMTFGAGKEVPDLTGKKDFEGNYDEAIRQLKNVQGYILGLREKWIKHSEGVYKEQLVLDSNNPLNLAGRLDMALNFLEKNRDLAIKLELEAKRRSEVRSDEEALGPRRNILSRLEIMLVTSRRQFMRSAGTVLTLFGVGGPAAIPAEALKTAAAAAQMFSKVEQWIDGAAGDMVVKAMKNMLAKVEEDLPVKIYSRGSAQVPAGQEPAYTFPVRQFYQQIQRKKESFWKDKKIANLIGRDVQAFILKIHNNDPAWLEFREAARVKSWADVSIERIPPEWFEITIKEFFITRGLSSETTGLIRRFMLKSVRPQMLETLQSYRFIQKLTPEQFKEFNGMVQDGNIPPDFMKKVSKQARGNIREKIKDIDREIAIIREEIARFKSGAGFDGISGDASQIDILEAELEKLSAQKRSLDDFTSGFARIFEQIRDLGLGASSAPARSESRKPYFSEIDLNLFDVPSWVKRAGELPKLDAYEATVLYVMTTGDEKAFFEMPRWTSFPPDSVPRFFESFAKRQTPADIHALFEQLTNLVFVPTRKTMLEKDKEETREMFQAYVTAIYSLENKVRYFKGLEPMVKIHQLKKSTGLESGVELQRHIYRIPIERLFRVYAQAVTLLKRSGRIFKIEKPNDLFVERPNGEFTSFLMPNNKDLPIYLHDEIAAAADILKMLNKKPDMTIRTTDMEDGRKIVTFEDLGSPSPIFIAEIIRPRIARSETRAGGYYEKWAELIPTREIKERFAKELEAIAALIPDAVEETMLKGSARNLRNPRLNFSDLNGVTLPMFVTQWIQVFEMLKGESSEDVFAPDNLEKMHPTFEAQFPLFTAALNLVRNPPQEEEAILGVEEMPEQEIAPEPFTLKIFQPEQEDESVPLGTDTHEEIVKVETGGLWDQVSLLVSEIKRIERQVFDQGVAFTEELKSGSIDGRKSKVLDPEHPLGHGFGHGAANGIGIPAMKFESSSAELKYRDLRIFQNDLAQVYQMLDFLSRQSTEDLKNAPSIQKQLFKLMSQGDAQIWSERLLAGVAKALKDGGIGSAEQEDIEAVLEKIFRLLIKTRSELDQIRTRVNPKQALKSIPFKDLKSARSEVRSTSEIVIPYSSLDYLKRVNVDAASEAITAVVNNLIQQKLDDENVLLAYQKIFDNRQSGNTDLYYTQQGPLLMKFLGDDNKIRIAVNPEILSILQSNIQQGKRGYWDSLASFVVREAWGLELLEAVKVNSLIKDQKKRADAIQADRLSPKKGEPFTLQLDSPDFLNFLNKHKTHLTESVAFTLALEVFEAKKRWEFLSRIKRLLPGYVIQDKFSALVLKNDGDIDLENLIRSEYQIMFYDVKKALNQGGAVRLEQEILLYYFFSLGLDQGVVERINLMQDESMRNSLVVAFKPTDELLGKITDYIHQFEGLLTPKRSELRMESNPDFSALKRIMMGAVPVEEAHGVGLYFESVTRAFPENDQHRVFISGFEKGVKGVLSRFRNPESEKAKSTLQLIFSYRSLLLNQAVKKRDAEFTAKFFGEVLKRWDETRDSAALDIYEENGRAFFYTAFHSLLYADPQGDWADLPGWNELTSLLSLKTVSFAGKDYTRGRIFLSGDMPESAKSLWRGKFSPGKNPMFQMELIDPETAIVNPVLIKLGVIRPELEKLGSALQALLDLPQNKADLFGGKLLMTRYVPSNPFYSNEFQINGLRAEYYLYGLSPADTLSDTALKDLGGQLAMLYLFGARDAGMKQFLLTNEGGILSVDHEFLFAEDLGLYPNLPSALDLRSDFWKLAGYLSAIQIQTLSEGFDRVIGLVKSDQNNVQAKILELLKLASLPKEYAPEILIPKIRERSQTTYKQIEAAASGKSRSEVRSPDEAADSDRAPGRVEKPIKRPFFQFSLQDLFLLTLLVSVLLTAGIYLVRPYQIKQAAQREVRAYMTMAGKEDAQAKIIEKVKSNPGMMNPALEWAESQARSGFPEALNFVYEINRAKSYPIILSELEKRSLWAAIPGSREEAYAIDLIKKLEAILDDQEALDLNSLTILRQIIRLSGSSMIRADAAETYGRAIRGSSGYEAEAIKHFLNEAIKSREGIGLSSLWFGISENPYLFTEGAWQPVNHFALKSMESRISEDRHRILDAMKNILNRTDLTQLYRNRVESLLRKLMTEDPNVEIQNRASEIYEESYRKNPLKIDQESIPVLPPGIDKVAARSESRSDIKNQELAEELAALKIADWGDKVLGGSLADFLINLLAERLEDSESRDVFARLQREPLAQKRKALREVLKNDAVRIEIAGLMLTEGYLSKLWVEADLGNPELKIVWNIDELYRQFHTDQADKIRMDLEHVLKVDRNWRFMSPQSLLHLRFLSFLTTLVLVISKFLPFGWGMPVWMFWSVMAPATALLFWSQWSIQKRISRDLQKRDSYLYGKIQEGNEVLYQPPSKFGAGIPGRIAQVLEKRRDKNGKYSVLLRDADPGYSGGLYSQEIEVPLSHISAIQQSQRSLERYPRISAAARSEVRVNEEVRSVNEQIPAYELLKTLQINELKLRAARIDNLSEYRIYRNIPIRDRLDPDQPPKTGEEILMNELIRLQGEVPPAEVTMDFIYNPEDQLIAIFPSNETVKTLVKKTRIQRMPYLDLASYYVDLPEFGSPVAARIWGDYAQKEKRDHEFIQKLITDEHTSKSGSATRFLVGRYLGSDAKPYVYAEISPGGKISKLEEFFPGEFKPEYAVKKEGFRQIIIPIYPTVYSPAQSVHLGADQKYYEGILQLPIKEGDPVLVGFGGSGFDTLLAYYAMLKTSGKEKIEDALFNYFELNPLGEANVRMIARLAGFKVDTRVNDNLIDGNGGPLFGDKRFRFALANMPLTDFSFTPSYRLPLTKYWDGDNYKTLKTFSENLSESLTDDALAHLWQNYYLRDGRNVIADIIEYAGKYSFEKWAPVEGAPSIFNVNTQIIPYFTGGAQRLLGIYEVTKKGAARSETRSSRALLGYLEKEVRKIEKLEFGKLSDGWTAAMTFDPEFNYIGIFGPTAFSVLDDGADIVGLNSSDTVLEVGGVRASIYAAGVKGARAVSYELSKPHYETSQKILDALTSESAAGVPDDLSQAEVNLNIKLKNENVFNLLNDPEALNRYSVIYYFGLSSLDQEEIGEALNRNMRHDAIVWVYDQYPTDEDNGVKFTALQEVTSDYTTAQNSRHRVFIRKDADRKMVKASRDSSVIFSDLNQMTKEIKGIGSSESPLRLALGETQEESFGFRELFAHGLANLLLVMQNYRSAKQPLLGLEIAGKRIAELKLVLGEFLSKPLNDRNYRSIYAENLEAPSLAWEALTGIQSSSLKSQFLPGHFEDVKNLIARFDQISKAIETALKGNDARSEVRGIDPIGGRSDAGPIKPVAPVEKKRGRQRGDPDEQLPRQPQDTVEISKEAEEELARRGDGGEAESRSEIRALVSVLVDYLIREKKLTNEQLSDWAKKGEPVILQIGAAEFEQIARDLAFKESRQKQNADSASKVPQLSHDIETRAIRQIGANFVKSYGADYKFNLALAFHLPGKEAGLSEVLSSEIVKKYISIAFMSNRMKLGKVKGNGLNIQSVRIESLGIKESLVADHPVIAIITEEELKANPYAFQVRQTGGMPNETFLDSISSFVEILAGAIVSQSEGVNRADDLKDKNLRGKIKAELLGRLFSEGFVNPGNPFSFDEEGNLSVDRGILFKIVTQAFAQARAAVSA